MARKAAQGQFVYDFEQPVKELDDRLEELREQAAKGHQGLEEQIRELEQESDRRLQEIVANLNPYQRVKLARHPRRGQSRDYIPLVFDDFIELHGDRRFGDDKAIVTGFAMLDGRRVMLIAQQKGRDTREKMASNFGMPQPEGYRKALAKMLQAEHFGLPVITFVDTPGAAAAIEAEERGQAMAIAENIFCMMGLRVPIVSVIIGEGCSGGALGVGVADRHGMLENAYYAVISPEGCAAILFRDAEKADEAAAAMRVTAQDMLAFGVVDEIITEPPGGAHRDAARTAESIKAFLCRAVDETCALAPDELLERRYGRYRALGAFRTVEPEQPPQ